MMGDMEARHDGWKAYAVGTLVGRQEPNPHPRGSREASVWRVGWLEAMMEDAPELHKRGAWPWKEE